MLLMMAEVMNFAAIARAYPNSLFWHILAYNQTHVPWAGLGLHDTIQPSFTFLVGVALPYSIASRRRKEQPFGKQLAHTVIRSLVLIALGIFLRSAHSGQTNFTFEDTLTQIGLGYTFAFLLGSMDRTGSNTLRLLAGMGPLPIPGSQLQLRRRRSSLRLDP
jgi:heparan-alpha-glucosaminide N-acetyltransferase